MCGKSFKSLSHVYLCILFPQHQILHLQRDRLSLISMGSEPEVIDISSDEEDESPNWIDELLDEKDDSIGIVDDDSDDECVILEGDPDKAIEVKEDKGGGEDDSDELLIVGEKGQVACRDFPHSRHLCASFPFSTTSHEKHCGLCHCYVCDSPAPCIYWGNGVSLSDHCHATDKAEMWKIQRKSIKVTYMERKPYDATLQMASPSVRNTAPLLFQVPVPLDAQPSQTNVLRPCMASSVGSPYVPRQSHQQQPASTGLRHHQQVAVTGPRHHPQAAVTGQRQHPQAYHPQAAVTGQRHHPQAAVTDPRHHPQAAVTGPRHHPQAAVTGPRHHPQAAVTGPRYHQQPAIISSHGQRLGQHTTRSRQSVSGTQGLHRGRHGVDALTHSFVQSHPKFKRAGNPVSGLINTGRNRPQDMASNQILSSLLQTSHYSLGASHRLQQQAITSHSHDTMVTSQQRSQCMPLASQISRKLPTSISSETQCMPVTSEDSVRNLQGILAGVTSELGVSDSDCKGMATFQPFTVSSLPSSVGGQVPSQIDSSQGMVLYPHLGSNATLSYPLDFDNSWSNRTAGVDFTRLGEAVQPSELASGLAQFGSILSSVKQEEDVYSAPVLYDFLGNWGCGPNHAAI